MKGSGCQLCDGLPEMYSGWLKNWQLPKGAVTPWWWIDDNLIRIMIECPIAAGGTMDEICRCLTFEKLFGPVLKRMVEKDKIKRELGNGLG